MSTLSTIEHLLDADVFTEQSGILKTTREPANKRIVPQKRFFSTKKQKVKKKKIQKPTTEEKMNFKNALLRKPIISTLPANDHDYMKK